MCGLSLRDVGEMRDGSGFEDGTSLLCADCLYVSRAN